MNLSKKAQSLLKRLGDTDDGSLRLTRPIAKAADELINQGLAIIVHRAAGGGDICLTSQGDKLLDSQ